MNVGEHSYGYLSTVKEDTKQRTSCTTAITIAHRAQHNTTGYSSWTIDWDERLVLGGFWPQTRGDSLPAGERLWPTVWWGCWWCGRCRPGRPPRSQELAGVSSLGSQRPSAAPTESPDNQEYVYFCWHRIKFCCVGLPWRERGWRQPILKPKPTKAVKPVSLWAPSLEKRGFQVFSEVLRSLRF